MSVYNFDKTSLFFGHEYRISDDITIKHPRVIDIKNLGYNCGNIYGSMYLSLAQTSFERKSYLYQMGVDYEKLSDFESFINLFTYTESLVEEGFLKNNIYSDALAYFCGGGNSHFVFSVDADGNPCFQNGQKKILNDEYCMIRDFIRTIHCMAEPDKSIPADEATKIALIEAEIEDRENGEFTISDNIENVLSSISFSLGNICESDLLNMPVYRIFNAFRRKHKLISHMTVIPAVYAKNVELKSTERDGIQWSSFIK